MKVRKRNMAKITSPIITDVTGQQILEAIQDASVWTYPNVPTQDGEYVLKCTVVGGVTTLSWKAVNNE